jgi:hypothetical protein
MQINWWKLEDYERQWREGLERIKIHPSSCLVVKVQHPKFGNFVEWWLLFKVGKEIYIYNQWLFREKYDEKIGANEFTPDTCYNFIGDREDLLATAREGGKIAEWIVNVDE